MGKVKLHYFNRHAFESFNRIFSSLDYNTNTIAFGKQSWNQVLSNVPCTAGNQNLQPKHRSD